MAHVFRDSSFWFSLTSTCVLPDSPWAGPPILLALEAVCGWGGSHTHTRWFHLPHLGRPWVIPNTWPGVVTATPLTLAQILCPRGAPEWQHTSAPRLEPDVDVREMECAAHGLPGAHLWESSLESVLPELLSAQENSGDPQTPPPSPPHIWQPSDTRAGLSYLPPSWDLSTSASLYTALSSFSLFTWIIVGAIFLVISPSPQPFWPVT